MTDTSLQYVLLRRSYEPGSDSC